MAKKDEIPQDVNEMTNFQAAWDANNDNMRAVTTRKGALRGSLSPADRAKGIEVLKRYGL